MSEHKNNALYHLIETTTAQPVVAQIDAITQSIRSRHEANVLAILGYGSCLRGEHVTDTLVDLYVLIDTYNSFHRNPMASWANYLLPPNVYYQECSFENEIIRCKYAVITLDQLYKKFSTDTSNPYFWARFCQPCALLYARDPMTRNRTIEALMSAAVTTSAQSVTLPPTLSVADKWTQILSHTYRTELRPEHTNRAASIVQANAAYFEALDHATAQDLPQKTWINSNWLQRRIIGKLLSVLRLIKAAFTFDGGADYLAWKITRHSGVEITLTPWQRRHPILAAPKLFWQLYRKGAFR